MSTIETSQEFMRRVEAERNDAGVTLSELERRSGYTRFGYQKALNTPTYGVSLEAAICYARALGLRISLTK
jgi:hypothetical protein